MVGGVLPQPPGRHADRDGRRARTPTHFTTAHLPERWTRVGRVVQLPGHRQPGRQRRRDGRQPARSHPDPRAADDGRVDLHRVRRHRRRPTTTTRSRGASATTAGACSTPASATPRPPSWRPTSSSTCRAGSRSRPATSRTPTCGVEPNAAPTVTASRAPSGAVDTGQPVAFIGDRRRMPTATRSPTRGTSATAEARPSASRRTRSRRPGTYAVKVTVSDGTRRQRQCDAAGHRPRRLRACGRRGRRGRGARARRRDDRRGRPSAPSPRASRGTTRPRSPRSSRARPARPR